LVAPLLRAAVRVFGHQPLLDHLTAFRFPLAGECAFTADVARELPIISGWGLELGWLCEVYRRVPPRQICQVELAANYDHKHRPLNAARGRAGLVDLAREIAHAFVSELHAEGLVLDAATAHALKLAFEKAAAEAAERHAHDALLNAMRHDAKAELLAVEAFAQVLAETLAGKPRGQFVLPAWNRVVAQSPQIADRLRELIVGD